ncbi:MAG: hypothetical protein M0008_05730 [Actinomycetota bacterium]|nr:hypothetical protein [Actinomycetota bacterium]
MTGPGRELPVTPEAVRSLSHGDLMALVLRLVAGQRGSAGGDSVTPGRQRIAGRPS